MENRLFLLTSNLTENNQDLKLSSLVIYINEIHKSYEILKYLTFLN